MKKGLVEFVLTALLSYLLFKAVFSLSGLWLKVFLFAGLLLISSIYFVHRYITAGKRLNADIDSFIKKNKHLGMMTPVMMVARFIADGQSKQAVLSYLSASKQSKVFNNEIYRQAQRMANPAFVMQKPYVTGRRFLLAVYLSIVVLSVIVAIGFVFKNKLVMYLGGGTWFLLVIFSDYLWRVAGCPQHISALAATIVHAWKNTSARWFKPFLTLYLLNVVRIQLSDSVFKKTDIGVFSRDAYQQFSRKQYLSGMANEHIEIQQDNVNVHAYTGDVREPYFKKEYASFDAFFQDYLSNTLSRVCGSEVAFLPKMFAAWAESHSKDYEGEEKVKKIRYSSELTQQLKQEQQAFFDSQIKLFMRSLRFKIIRSLI